MFAREGILPPGDLGAIQTMHRDVKIGLILGVLLIALVAALFFRREPIEDFITLGKPTQDPSAAYRSPPTPLVRLPSQPVVVEPAKPVQQPVGDPFAGPSVITPTPATPNATHSSPSTKPANTNTPSPLNGVTHPAGEAHLPFRQPGEVTTQNPWQLVPTGAHPASGAHRKHRIQAGDSLWRVAEEYLGDGRRADDIFRANQNVLKTPDHLPLGVELVIPATAGPNHARSDSALVADAASSARRLDAPPVITEGRVRNAAPTRNPKPAEAASVIRRYTVKPGETLREIARKVFRDEERWRDIFRENRSQLDDPRNLQAGMTIRLPVR